MMNVLHPMLSIAVGVIWTTITGKVSKVDLTVDIFQHTNTDPVDKTTEGLGSGPDTGG